MVQRRETTAERVLERLAVLERGTPDEIVANPSVRRVYLGENFRLH